MSLAYETPFDTFFIVDEKQVCLKDFYLSNLLRNYEPSFKNSVFLELKKTPAEEVFLKYPKIEEPKQTDYNFEKEINKTAVFISKKIISTFKLNEKNCLEKFVYIVENMPIFVNNSNEYWKGTFQIFTTILWRLNQDKKWNLDQESLILAQAYSNSKFLIGKNNRIAS